jgi:hypothetical protein
MKYAYEINAKRIIDLIKSHDGIETKQICTSLDLTVNQFVCAQPLIENYCYRLKKKWRITVVEEVSPRIRKSPTATVIYRMMPVSQLGLKEKMGMHKDSIWRALKLLREHKLIHITGYETGSNTIYPIFDKGYGIDATRPSSKFLEAQRAKRYREKYKEKGALIDKSYKERNRELLRAKQIARYWLKRDEINAKAREKARLKREAKEMVETMPTNVLMTRWVGANPFAKAMI